MSTRPEETSGRLHVVATPIGNLADITLRAIRTLEDVDVIAAEDTRTTRKLLTHHGIRTRLVAYHAHNEETRTAELLDRMLAGERVAIVSEAGTPSISDPGYRLVREAIAHGITVEPIPGPSAVLAGLVVSGLPTDAVVFEGFLPRRVTERRRRLRGLGDDPRTLVFFEAPHRLDRCLTDLLEVLGDRPMALCRELTKMHEEVRRGQISEVIASLHLGPVKGELVLVVGGAAGAGAPDLEGAVEEVLRRTAEGEGMRETTRAVAAERGVPRRALYDRALERRREERR